MITEHICYTITCATAGCDPWDDGIPHFPTPHDATAYAQGSGWTIIGDTALCGNCSSRADCERTSHQWDTWRDANQDGVAYQTRWCDHCADLEYDPPFQVLAALLDAARIVNTAVSQGEAR